MLWVEPSAACNLDCDGCPTATGRGAGSMPLGDFIRVISGLPWLKALNLWHRGEPLAAPQFPEMVAEAARRGVWTQTYSNGLLLNRGDLARRLVEAGLNRITIGVDGPDEETYRRLRRGGSLVEVEAGIRALVEAKRELKTTRPKIIAECLVARQTRAQFLQVRELVLEWGCDDVKFKTYRVPEIDDTEDGLSRLPEERALWRYRMADGRLAMKRKRRGCHRLSYSALVAWNGEVLPCCFDSQAEFKVGNALLQPWGDIWRGEPFSSFKQRVNGNRDDIPMCRNCTEGLARLYLPRRLVLACT